MGRRRCRCYRRAIQMLYKYLHVVFMLPIYSHDFSISFNQAMFERERKRDFVMITYTAIFCCCCCCYLFFLMLKMGFCSMFSLELYLCILLQMIFSSCSSNSFIFTLFPFQVCIYVCVYESCFFLVASVMLRDALNSNERQFVFMCLSMALLRHSQFFSETSSLFCIFFAAAV